MKMRCRHKEFESKSFQVECASKTADGTCIIDDGECRILSTEVSVDAESIPAIKRLAQKLRQKEEPECQT